MVSDPKYHRSALRDKPGNEQRREGLIIISRLRRNGSTNGGIRDSTSGGAERGTDEVTSFGFFSTLTRASL